MTFWGSALRAATAALVLGTTASVTNAQNASFVSPDIVVLGDSQISFGSGPAYVDFLSDLEASCSPNMRQKRSLRKLGEGSVAVIGVRSTSIHSWTARGGAAKGSVCDVDKKWKVNAGSYGVVNTSENPFVQIGQGRNYQFCRQGQSPFEAMFRDGYYSPRLLILTFLGNATKRWAENSELTQRDANRLSAQLPADVPCVFMTTAPAYTKKVSDRRLKAQKNIKAALERSGMRCTFVEGITPDTVAANQGNKSFFRRNKSGKVKDPFHPNERGARHHLKLRAPAICDAIFTELKTAQPPS